MSVSIEEMKAITRRFVDEPWNQGNVDVFDELCGSEYTLVGNGISYGHGTSQLKQVIVQYRKVIPNLTAEITEMIAEGEKVAYGWVMRGTHAPSGKTWESRGITILRFADGKIVHDQFQSSSPSLDQQIA